MLGHSYEWLCQRIVEDTPDAVIFADREGIIRVWNRGAESMFGYRDRETLGASLDLIIPENLRPRHNAGYRRVMAGGATKYGKGTLKVPALTKDGATISIEFTLALIRGQSGEILGSAAIIREVTARRLEEKELRRRLAASAGREK